MAEATGLRERKKQRTHDTIVRAALELFAERGFQATTVADIAAMAEVAPSTVFAYFPTKEDIVFARIEPFWASIRTRIETRPSGESAISAVRDWSLKTIPDLISVKTRDSVALRRIIDGDERLQMHERARMTQLNEVLSAAIAADFATAPDPAIGRIVAGALSGAISATLSADRQVDAATVESEIKLAFTFVEAGTVAIMRASLAVPA